VVVGGAAVATKIAVFEKAAAVASGLVASGADRCGHASDRLG
jgi:hypothetical protein